MLTRLVTVREANQELVWVVGVPQGGALYPL